MSQRINSRIRCLLAVSVQRYDPRKIASRRPFVTYGGNPFTTHLRRLTRPTEQSPRLSAREQGFIETWDRLETLIISVYRAGSAAPEDSAELAALRDALRPAYADLASDLERHWRQARIGKDPAVEDPFEALLAFREAADFIDNWEAMRTLPAAREALNRWLLS